MKQFYLLFIALSFLSISFAQSVPQGMKYQAVARDAKGQVLANKKITLRIGLADEGKKPTVFYSELHQVTTSELGLFNLVIGAGQAESGQFKDVPWSTKDIWMQVALKVGDAKDFTAISSSKLLAVPYAFHAETASSLVQSAPQPAQKAAAAATTATTDVINEPCEKCDVKYGMVTVKLLYLGPTGVQINVFKDQKNKYLLTRFPLVKDGDIITVDARTMGLKKLPSEINIQVVYSGIPLTTIPTGDKSQITSSVFNNFSVVSILAYNGDKYPVTSECTVCDIAQDWKVNGNVLSELCNRLGSKNQADLSLMTNNVNRLNINKAGDVVITNITESTSLLTGALTVNGGTAINKNLNVGGATTLNGATKVANASPTTLTGTLQVDGNTTLKQLVALDNASLKSTSPATGALVVSGGAGIGENLNVGGDLNVTGKTGLTSLAVNNNVSARSLNITDNNESYIATFNNTNTGNGDGLKIKLGGIHPLWNGTAYEQVNADDLNPIFGTFKPQIDRIKEWQQTGVNVQPQDFVNLLSSTGKFLGGALCQLTNFLTPKINEGLHLPYDIAAPINKGIGLPYDMSKKINDGIGLPYDLTKPINDGLKLPQKLSILQVIDNACDLCVPDKELPGPSLEIVPALPTAAIPAIPAFSLPAVPSFSIPSIPQISCDGLPNIQFPDIKTTNVTGSLSNSNEYLKFVDKDERQLGAIRAQSIANFKDEHLSTFYLFKLVSVIGGVDIARSILRLAGEINNVAHAYNKLGVEYISGNGDYAEWMMREDVEEEISAGDIVAVKSGRITKNLEGAEQVMAVSSQPVILANMPVKEKVALGNTIAFMGQIPVKIIGPVTTGDFIVARSPVAGYGVAINADKMTLADYKLVIGRAWETMPADGPKMVNTIVGIQNNEFLKIIQKYQVQLEATAKRLDAIEARLNMKKK